MIRVWTIECNVTDVYESVPLVLYVSNAGITMHSFSAFDMKCMYSGKVKRTNCFAIIVTSSYFLDKSQKSVSCWCDTVLRIHKCTYYFRVNLLLLLLGSNLRGFFLEKTLSLNQSNLKSKRETLFYGLAF